jgi:hypothetical protein
VTDLISALQEGPGSRELSDRVLWELGWGLQTERWPGRLEDQQIWYPPNSEDAFVGERPDPSQSIDDAVALVPEGMDCTVCTKGWALVFGESPPMGRLEEVHRAPTPALALCVAIIRALNIDATPTDEG